VVTAAPPSAELAGPDPVQAIGECCHCYTAVVEYNKEEYHMTTAPTAVDERQEAFRKLREAGYTYTEIGYRYGLSAERVRQIADLPAGRAAGASGAKRREALAAEIAAYLEEHGPTPRSEIRERFEITESRLGHMIAEGLPSHLLLTPPRSRQTHYSDVAVFEALQRVHGAVGKPWLSYSDYEENRNRDDPSAALIIARYGWSAACKKAGVDPGWTNRAGAYKSAWTDEAIIESVREYVRWAADNGRRPTYLAYDEWQKRDPKHPSGTLVRIRMKALGHGTWPSILDLALAAGD
jgi:hypothetical protein